MQTILHASCVSLAGRGALILGPSGSGKSSLALELIALGADLVSDDRTIVTRQGNDILAACPETGRGLIEARGIGIVRLAHITSCKLVLVIDLSQIQRARLPQGKSWPILDMALPCLHKVDAVYFPAAIHACLRGTILEVE